MLGDKFLKEQDARLIAEPYISEVIYIDQSSESFALLARWVFLYQDLYIEHHCWISRLPISFRRANNRISAFSVSNLCLHTPTPFSQLHKSLDFVCSDGFWDVINTKKAFQLVHQVICVCLWVKTPFLSLQSFKKRSTFVSESQISSSYSSSNRQWREMRWKRRTLRRR